MSQTIHDRLRLPNAVLLPFALVQSQVFWVCSVIWTLCLQWSTEEHPESPPLKRNQQQEYAVDATAALVPQDQRLEHLRRHGRRPRGNSEPLTPTTAGPIELFSATAAAAAGRTRCTTISFPPSRKQRLLQTRRQLEGIEIRPSREDERAGATCPPQWWQKTRFYIDALKHQPASSSTATLPSTTPPDTPPIVVASPPAMPEADPLASLPPPPPPSARLADPEPCPATKKRRRRATILGLLHHQHRPKELDHDPRDTAGSKNRQRRTRSLFWKKRSSVIASATS